MWMQRREANKPQREGDHRNPYQRDKARILHSAAFRRLQAKTQVLGVGIGDFYRTRLTHSLEASQIGQGIAAQLQSKYPELTAKLELDHTLIEALCLAHDIGHPPFGHGGEVALHYMMHQHGGFEGNGQTFRIVNTLEPYTLNYGMNLSRRTILGLVKYPSFIDSLTNPALNSPTVANSQVKAGDWHPPKGLYRCDQKVFEWLIAPMSDADQQHFTQSRPQQGKHQQTQFKSFDCSIMELADDIAYAIHDLEDAIVMGMVHREVFFKDVVEPVKATQDLSLSGMIEVLTDKLFSEFHHQRKDAIGALVNYFITSISIELTDESFEQNLLRYNAMFPPAYDHALNLFKKFVFRHVIKKPEIQVIEYKGQQIVMALFEAFASDPERLLPINTRSRWLQAVEVNNGHRVIADYIAGMTDGFASKLYADLFLPKGGILNDAYTI